MAADEFLSGWGEKYEPWSSVEVWCMKELGRTTQLGFGSVAIGTIYGNFCLTAVSKRQRPQQHSVGLFQWLHGPQG